MTDILLESTTPLLAIDGPRATIRLNRPKHLNRLQQDDLEALMALFARIEADPKVRVLVLTGTGRAFSAGFDLNSIAERAGTISLALKTHKLPIHWSETSGDVSRDIKSMMLDIVLDVVKAKPLLDRIPPDQLPQ